jgi:hypothetical protein
MLMKHEVNPLAGPANEKTSAWEKIKKAVLSQIPVIIITPLTVFVTILATERSETARPEIVDHITVTTHYRDNAPPASFYDSLKNNVHLYQQFGQRLTTMTIYPKSAKTWLSTGAGWDFDCSTVFKDISGQILNTINSFENIAVINRPIDYENAENKLPEIKSICSRFIGIINNYDAQPQTPTGQVDFRLSIINSSAYDGIIYKDAKLKFDGVDLDLRADTGYLPLNAHSIQKISFSTNYLAGNGLMAQGAKNGSNEAELKSRKMYPAYSQLEKLIAADKKIPYELTITVDGKELPAKKGIINN